MRTYCKHTSSRTAPLKGSTVTICNQCNHVLESPGLKASFAPVREVFVPTARMYQKVLGNAKARMMRMGGRIHV